MTTALDPIVHVDRPTASATPAPAQDLAAIEREPLAGAMNIPLTLLAPNRFQPRRRRGFEPESIAELAESIAKLGLLQPILVRPSADAVAGEPLYEIVAGERRWRASIKLAEATKSKRGGPVPTIAAIVRDIDDYTAMEMATVENLNREALHELDEAAGYDMLLHPPIQVRGAPAKPLTVRDLAARFSKSVGYISGRLKLLTLVPKARDAFYEKRIEFSIALIIARVPQEQQEKLLKECLQGYGNKPFTHAEALQHVERCYMLQLARAPFKITDASLVPDAGSCRECPKRTGANPDLFADVKGADVCTDSACFNRKVEAEQQRKRQAAEDAGMRIVAKGKTGEYLRLDEHDYHLTDGSKTIGQLLGKNSGVEIVMVETSDQGLVPAVKTADAKEALKAKGALRTQRSSSSGSGRDYMRETEEKSKAGTAWRRAVAINCLAALAEPAAIDGNTSLAIVRLAAEAHYCRMESDNTKRMHNLLGSEPIDASRYSGEGMTKVRQAVAAMTPEDLIRFLAAMAISTDLYLPPHYTDDKGKDTRLAELAALCRVNLGKVRDTILAERKAALKEKLKPKAKATTPVKGAAGKSKTKPATKRAARPVKEA